MGTEYNAEEIPDFVTPPEMVAAFKIESVEVTPEDRQLAVDVHVRITDSQPPIFRNYQAKKRFWLGTKDDLRADEPDTRKSRDWTAYKKALRVLHVTSAGDLLIDAENLTEHEGLGFFRPRTFTKQDGTEGSSLDLVAIYELGTLEIGPTAGTTRARGVEKANSNGKPSAQDAARRAMGEDE